MYSTASSLK